VKNDASLRAKKWAEANPERHKASVATWFANHPGYQRAYGLKRRYGITVEEYDELLSQQEGRCAICYRIVEETLCVDHNHVTGKIRGLLCTRCNRSLGWLERFDSSITKYRNSF
jgi:hypothetical protein